MKARRVVIAGVVVTAAAIGLGWLALRKAPKRASAGASSGEALARVYCQSCHIFPEPGILDKASWTNGVLPEMARWLGLVPPIRRSPASRGTEGGETGSVLDVFPSSPLISQGDWAEVVRYYAQAAPVKLEQGMRPGIAPETKQFRVKESAYKRRVPMTSMVSYGGLPGASGTGVARASNSPALYVGDALTHTLEGLDASGNRMFAVEFDSGPISLVQSSEGRIQNSPLDVLLVGRLFPSDLTRGKVVRLQPQNDGMKIDTLLRGLRRPVHMVAADLNGDGREDLVVSEFGNLKGKLSWWELLPQGPTDGPRQEGRYREHVLLDRAGAIRTEVRDMTGDGRPDIVALMGQGWEGVYLFVNSSGGSPGSSVSFTQRILLQQHPAWGYSYFELVDFDKDGDLDLLTTNGDNGEAYAGSFAPHKPYHGIRLYLNNGKNEFTERWFFPLHGAYGARGVDFDLDGDLDMAAISYFPDFAVGSPGFVYLENEGGFRFQASTIPQHVEGRWITMDAGDLDGDGDVDIVIGSLVLGPTSIPIPQAIQERWTNNAPAILVLENVAK